MSSDVNETSLGVEDLDVIDRFVRLLIAARVPMALGWSRVHGDSEFMAREFQHAFDEVMDGKHEAAFSLLLLSDLARTYVNPPPQCIPSDDLVKRCMKILITKLSKEEQLNN